MSVWKVTAHTSSPALSLHEPGQDLRLMKTAAWSMLEELFSLRILAGEIFTKIKENQVLYN